MRALLCLAVAVFLQIGVNFANDYSDGVRGTDKHRVGPPRLVGSGRAKPRTVLIVALVFFALAARRRPRDRDPHRSTGGCSRSAPSRSLAAWFYTGGKRPYGYYGLGELSVFVFFGIVAVAGTTFVQVGTVTLESWLGGVAAGLIACAVLHGQQHPRSRAGQARAASAPSPCCSATSVARRLRGPDAAAVRDPGLLHVLFYANAGLRVLRAARGRARGADRAHRARRRASS